MLAKKEKFHYTLELRLVQVKISKYLVQLNYVCMRGYKGRFYSCMNTLSLTHASTSLNDGCINSFENGDRTKVLKRPPTKRRRTANYFYRNPR